jgi:hypothetical protein
MDQAAAEVQELQERLAQAQLRLQAERDQAMKQSVGAIVAALPAHSGKANTIVCSGRFGSFKVAGKEYATGMARLPMHALRRAKVLDFGTYLMGVFQAPGTNIKEKVCYFLADKWEDMKTYELHLLPIDVQAKMQGRRKCDLPNVTFVLVAEYMKRDMSMVVVDPVHKGTDESVAILDLKRVYRALQDMLVKVPLPFAPARSDEALEFIVYQRGGGNPDERTMQALTDATGLTRDNVLHMHLVPGKYEQGKCTWGGNCRADFEKSVLLILHELAVVVPFAQALKKRSVHKLWFVLDEFSAYAAYTAIAIQAFGLDKVAGVLCYRQGVYTPM